MAKILRPYEVPLDEDLAREILDIPMYSEDFPPPRTIGERVRAAVNAVTEANEHLKESRLARIVAETLMKQLKKRGTASVRVKPDGSVVLHVSYDEPVETEAPAVQRASWKSDLPKLAVLREEAADLGLDVTDLGQQRRAIWERIQKEKEQRNGHGPTRLIDEVSESALPDQLSSRSR